MALSAVLGVGLRVRWSSAPTSRSRGCGTACWSRRWRCRRSSTATAGSRWTARCRATAGALLVVTLSYYPLVYLPVVAAPARARPRRWRRSAWSLGHSRWRVVLAGACCPSSARRCSAACCWSGCTCWPSSARCSCCATRPSPPRSTTSTAPPSTAPAANMLAGVLVLVLPAAAARLELRLRGRAPVRPGRRAARPRAGGAASGSARRPGAGGRRPDRPGGAVALGVPTYAPGPLAGVGHVHGVPARRPRRRPPGRTVGLAAVGAAADDRCCALPVAWLAVRHRGSLVDAHRAQHLRRQRAARHRRRARPGDGQPSGWCRRSTRPRCCSSSAYAILFLPRAVVSVRAGLEQAPPVLDDVARSLGSGPLADRPPGHAAADRARHRRRRGAGVPRGLDRADRDAAARADRHRHPGHRVLVGVLGPALRRRRAVRPAAGRCSRSPPRCCSSRQETTGAVSRVELRGSRPRLRRRPVLSTASTSSSPTARHRRPRALRAAARPRCCAWSPGFLAPDAGTIRFDDRVVAGEGGSVPPQQRRVGYVPQEGALFPHLDVAANIGFGLPRPQRRRGGRRVAEMLDLVELPAVVRRPARRTSSPAASSSGSRSPARWRRSRRWCCSTSRSPPSTPSLREQHRPRRRPRAARPPATTARAGHPRPGRGAVAGRPGRGDARTAGSSRPTPPRDLYRAPVDPEVGAFVGGAAVRAGASVRRRPRDASRFGSAPLAGRRPRRRRRGCCCGPSRSRSTAGQPAAPGSSEVHFYGHDASVRLRVLPDGPALVARVAGLDAPRAGRRGRRSAVGRSRRARASHGRDRPRLVVGKACLIRCAGDAAAPPPPDRSRAPRVLDLASHGDAARGPHGRRAR